VCHGHSTDQHKYITVSLIVLCYYADVLLTKYLLILTL